MNLENQIILTHFLPKKMCCNDTKVKDKIMILQKSLCILEGAATHPLL